MYHIFTYATLFLQVFTIKVTIKFQNYIPHFHTGFMTGCAVRVYVCVFEDNVV